MAIEDRISDQAAQLSRLQARVDELERLGAARWGIVDPKGLEVGFAMNAGGSQGSITSLINLTGMLVNWTAVNGRRYRFDWTVTVQQLTSASTFNIALTDGADTLISNPGITLAAAAFATLTCFHELPGLSGAQTHKLRGSTGAGTLTILNGAANASWLTITDVGPG